MPKYSIETRCPVCESAIDLVQPEIWLREIRKFQVPDRIPSFDDEKRAVNYAPEIKKLLSKGPLKEYLLGLQLLRHPYEQLWFHWGMLLPNFPRDPSHCSLLAIPSNKLYLVLRKPSPIMGEGKPVLGVWEKYLGGVFESVSRSAELTKIAELDIVLGHGDEFPSHF